MAINNGGPAFPAGAVRKSRAIAGDPGSDFVVLNYVDAKNPGMTLRDYFAAKALASLIGHEKEDVNRGKKAVPTLAKWAYEYADAMLEAREV